MAGEIRVIRHISILKDGALQLAHGTTEAPKQAVAISATKVNKQTFTIAAGASETVWTYSAGADAKVFVIESSGLLDVSLKVQKATSTTDKTPTGTAVYPKASVSSYAPLVLDAQVLYNGTSANLVGSHFAGSGNEPGYIYEIAVKNPSSTTSVTVTVLTTD